MFWKYINVDKTGVRGISLDWQGLKQRSSSSTPRLQMAQPRKSDKFQINFRAFKAEHSDEDKPMNEYIYSLIGKKEKIILA